MSKKKVSAAQKLRNIIAGEIDKRWTAEQIAENIVRRLTFGNDPDFLIVNGKVYKVLEAEFVDGIDNEIGWNVYTTED